MFFYIGILLFSSDVSPHSHDDFECLKFLSKVIITEYSYLSCPVIRMVVPLCCNYNILISPTWEVDRIKIDL